MGDILFFDASKRIKPFVNKTPIADTGARIERLEELANKYVKDIKERAERLEENLEDNTDNDV